MSDSVRPHGLQPTRLLRPWNFPGKSTGAGCHRILGEKLYTVAKTTHGADCGSDHQFLFAKFRLKLKKVGKTTRLFKYDWNQIPYDCTVEVINRFKGLALVGRVLEELWIEVCNIVQEAVSKTIPKKKKFKKAKWLSEEALQIAFLFFSQLFVRPSQTANLLFCFYFSWGWFWSQSSVQCYEPLSIVLQALCQIYFLESICHSHHAIIRDLI